MSKKQQEQVTQVGPQKRHILELSDTDVKIAVFTFKRKVEISAGNRKFKHFEQNFQK